MTGRRRQFNAAARPAAATRRSSAELYWLHERPCRQKAFLPVAILPMRRHERAQATSKMPRAYIARHELFDAELIARGWFKRQTNKEVRHRRRQGYFAIECARP